MERAVTSERQTVSLGVLGTLVLVDEGRAPVAVPAKVPATTTPAIITPAAPANGTPANEGAKTAPQPVATPGTTKGATP